MWVSEQPPGVMSIDVAYIAIEWDRLRFVGQRTKEPLLWTVLM